MLDGIWCFFTGCAQRNYFKTFVWATALILSWLQDYKSTITSSTRTLTQTGALLLQLNPSVSSPVWANCPCSAVWSWWPRGSPCVKQKHPRLKWTWWTKAQGRIQLCKTVSASVTPVVTFHQFAIQLDLTAANQYRPSHFSTFDQHFASEIITVKLMMSSCISFKNSTLFYKPKHRSMML